MSQLYLEIIKEITEGTIYVIDKDEYYFINNKNLFLPLHKIILSQPNMNKNIPIKVYTDGACKGNPGKGGWGWVEYSGKKYNDKEILFVDSGGEQYTTNNQMELTAIIEHLKHAPRGMYYIIHSDSKYSLQGIVKDGEGVLKTPGVYTGWLKGWIKTNFVGKKNVELWKELESLINDHLKNGSVLEFKHVKAHVGIEGNELADLLANIGVPKG